MDPSLIKRISQDIYRRFPEFVGISPKVRVQAMKEKPSSGLQTFLLTYNHQANLPDHKTLPRWVRVVANEQGKIIKITTSR
jgi:hypothetical protein